jgi:hypothetical protein
MISIAGISQPSIEMSTKNFAVALPGPSLANVGPIAMMKDNSNNNNHTNLGSNEATNITFSLANQQYTGLGYSNISTGLVFGAQPTTASGGTVQKVDPLDIYNNLGYFEVFPGGPTDNMFTVSPSFPSGTGIVANPQFIPNPPDVNGAVSIFTSAQVQFDRPGGPSAHNSSTRYYYGDLVINLNRFIRNPVIHIAGLGGAYRYFPANGTNINDPSQWRSTFFSTELEIQGFSLTKLSGNSFFNVNGQYIVNTAASPSGASVSTTGGLFDELGAASGSIRIGATLKTIVIRVYLRGSDNSQFPWSTLQANVANSSRNPFTGDIWWVSVSTDAEQLVPLPSTGLSLSGSLVNNNVVLNWKTLSELNTNNFEVERSTDGVNFSSLAVKPAAGYSVSERSYGYTDDNMNVNVYYYRIRLNDLDGKYSYSNVIAIRKNGGIKGIRLYPNPVVSNLNVEFSGAKGTYVVSLFSQSGQEVITQRTEIGSDFQTISIAKGSLPAGTYFLKIRNISSGDIYSDKVVLQ